MDLSNEGKDIWMDGEGGTSRSTDIVRKHVVSKKGLGLLCWIWRRTSPKIPWTLVCTGMHIHNSELVLDSLNRHV